MRHAQSQVKLDQLVQSCQNSQHGGLFVSMWCLFEVIMANQNLSIVLAVFRNFLLFVIDYRMVFSGCFFLRKNANTSNCNDCRCRYNPTGRFQKIIQCYIFLFKKVYCLATHGEKSELFLIKQNVKLPFIDLMIKYTIPFELSHQCSNCVAWSCGTSWWC